MRVRFLFARFFAAKKKRLIFLFPYISFLFWLFFLFLLVKLSFLVFFTFSTNASKGYYYDFW